MKCSRFTCLFTALLLLFMTSTVLAQQSPPPAPFRRGVNLSGWFQAAQVRQIHFTKYTRQDFEQIKSLGCDAIRLPINLHAMTGGAPNYVLDPLFYSFLDEVVGWAETLDLHLILDNHAFDPAVATPPDIGIILEKVWSQMAQHYQHSSAKLYFEILNEPHGIADAQWNSIQQKVVTTIRRHNSRHTIVVGPANWNSFHNLDEMPVYEDNNLLYTFHFYDPFLLTHQGAGWVDPSMEALTGVPFPYSAERMPPLPNALKGTWIESAYANYPEEGTIAQVTSLIDLAARFAQERQVPLYCGEFGVYIPNSPPSDRILWYETVRKYLEEREIAWTSWDYHGGFGLFEPGGNDLFEHDLNLPLLEALGLELPEQTAYVPQIEQDGFALFTDHLGPKIMDASYGNGLLNFYSTDKPNNGQHALSWSGADQYSSIGFKFRPTKDLSALVAEGYALDFLFRGTAPGVAFDIRFIDTKTEDPHDRPWRSRVTIDPERVAFDGYWYHLHLPLSEFQEQGSWDGGAWHSPQGKFDWAALDRLEITAEHAALGNGSLWFDNIYITQADTARVLETSVFPGELTAIDASPASWKVEVYPNPSLSYLILKSSLSGAIKMELTDSLGKVRIVQTVQEQTRLDLSSLPAGLYFLKISHPDGRQALRRVVKQ